jgi:hypothetical protein
MAAERNRYAQGYTIRIVSRAGGKTAEGERSMISVAGHFLSGEARMPERKNVFNQEHGKSE